MRHTLPALLTLTLLGSPLAAAEPKPTPEQLQFFETKVRPLLADECFRCHGEKKQNNGLRLDSAAAIRDGGKTGPALVPGKPGESLLIKAINHDGPKMPPKTKLKPEEIAALTEWVKMGAPWPAETKPVAGRTREITEADRQFWAFRPVADPPVPAVKDAAWPKNPIDHFILAALEAKGLKPVSPADKRTLIRRATFDLTGLPPTPEEIGAFLADNTPDAFAKVVDRLLASPAYGERWGRHWLDVVRYADTAGDNSDYPVPQLYKSRNWVIQAFNQDKPYDQFVREQLAGDLMGGATEAERRERIVATGYLGNTRRFGSYEMTRYPWHLTIEDSIDNLGRTFLGLTINCSRCHDHKFDPITMEDYYGLYGFFQSTRYPWPGIELDKVPKDLVPLVPPEQFDAVVKERAKKTDGLNERVMRLEEQSKDATNVFLREMLAAICSRENRAKAVEAKQRVDDLGKSLQAVRKERDNLAKQALPIESAYAVAEGKKIGNCKMQLRGDPEKPGMEVPRKFPAILGGQTLSSDVKGSGRLELAHWLTDPSNPLTARVMVNRIWHYHFGHGLVPTRSDFGKQGRTPTHPELLDYLARRFIDNSWSVKAMHRMIMLSRTYQLSSQDDAENLKTDPGNEYLWRHNRRRLEAEAIRDATLMVSGGLDPTPGAAHPFPDQTTWDFTQHKPFKGVYETNRRSVYLMTQRVHRHPFLALFDGSDTNTGTAMRETSTTPLQALFLMNDPFVHEQARRFAARLLGERSNTAERIDRAYLLLVGRPATNEERTAAEDYLEQARAKLASAAVPSDRRGAAAWESLCRALFMMNEFVYVN